MAVNPRSLVCEMQPVRIEIISNASVKIQNEIEPFLESLNRIEKNYGQMNFGGG